MVEMPVIDENKCNGCGLCVGVCSCSALAMIHNRASVTETEACNWCVQCEAVCPTGAIACPFEIVMESKG